MRTFLWMTIMMFLACFASSEKIVGCYWGAWTSISQIDVSVCTHAYFAFYVTDSYGVIRPTNPGLVSNFLALRNGKVKLLASIGGYNAGTANFVEVASNSAKRDAFINNCVNLAVYSNFDGIDLDWEYPEPAEQQLFVDLLQKLKQSLNAKGKLLAIAAGAGTWRVSQSYKISEVCANVDIMNLMSYDMQWPYTVTGTNAGYDIINTAVSIWINGGCPANKLVLGLAAYGYNFNLVSSGSNGIGASAYGATATSYREICSKLNSGAYTVRNYDQTPVAIKGNEWISYDDVTSLAAKVRGIVTGRNLAGAFFWSTDLDDYDNSCGTGRFPLITSVFNLLVGSSGGSNSNNTPSPTIAPITTAAPITIATTTAASSGPFSCSGKPDGFYANPVDCTKFYRCVIGVTYSFACSSGLGWNQLVQACDWKFNIPGC